MKKLFLLLLLTIPAIGQNVTAVERIGLANTYCADAGGTDSYACNLSSAPGIYVTGAIYSFKANTANTGAATISYNGMAAKTIVKVVGGITTTLANNDIRVGQVVVLNYDGTNMQMQSTLGNAATGSGDVVGPGSATDNALARYDGVTGLLLQDSGVIVDDSGNVTIPASLSTGGAADATCDGTASCIIYHEGTAPAGQSADGIQEIAPAAITSYRRIKPGTIGVAGVVKVAVSGVVATESFGLVTGTECPTCTLTIASGAKALDTDAIASEACDTMTDTATGAATTDVVVITPNADITAVVGYAPETTGGLAIYTWLTSNTLNIKVCNPSGSSITPGAVTLNWRVVR